MLISASLYFSCARKRPNNLRFAGRWRNAGGAEPGIRGQRLEEGDRAIEEVWDFFRGLIVGIALWI